MAYGILKAWRVAPAIRADDAATRARGSGSRWPIRLALYAMALAFWLGEPGWALAQPPASPYSRALAVAADTMPLPSDGAIAHGLSRARLLALYPEETAWPLWFDSGGRATPQAMQALAALATSDTRGLRPAEYDVAALQSGFASISGRATAGGADVAADVTAIASLDVELSLQLMRLMAHLHAGRVDPRTVGFRLPEMHDWLDLASLALTISRSPDVAAAIRAEEPPYAGYAALITELARYRALAAGPEIRPPDPGRVLRSGDAYADAPALARFLIILGDLPRVDATAAIPAQSDSIYDDALVDGVTTFQKRHGLDPDGIVGPATVEQLRTPLASRVQQIELAMERWRWLPDVAPERYVVVNVPAFRVYAFEDDPTASRPVLRMNVVVGSAGRRATPMFVGSMSQVVFQPYWDVPYSISRNELVPKARRDGGYMARERLEIVRGGDHDATIFANTSANLNRVARGELRMRQRPGANNSLGPVKFLFPNEFNVYLHGTPATQLFMLSRRDFSHGCIRVEDPTALATWVLKDQAEWDRDSVAAAMTEGVGSASRSVPIARPIPVYVLYSTAVVGDDGAIRFYQDIYGHDAQLVRALE